METVTVVMLVSSGRSEDSTFFDYRPSYFGDIVRVEWESDTDRAVLPRETADYLIRHNYARPVPDDVSTEATAPSSPATPMMEPSPEVVEEKAPTRKKEKSK